MYIPSSFKETRPDVLHNFMRDYSFATLVTLQGEMTASHLPFLLDPNQGAHGTLRGHLARANGQWRAFDGVAEAMVIFQGPHAYISPQWYLQKLSVPTWNYVAIHAYGRPRVIEDAAVFRALLASTVDKYESGRPRPWKMETLPDDFVAKMQEQIVGFEMEITRLEGKAKLNQNRSHADRQSVIDALRQTGDPLSAEVARLMGL